jgi:hypothetical protein
VTVDDLADNTRQRRDAVDAILWSRAADARTNRET